MKTAKCQCGQLSVDCEGDHSLHVQCSCETCQRRTGTPTSFQIYFKESQTTVHGRLNTYAREAVGERKVICHFCPDCGSFVFSTGQFANELFGEKMRILALGCFNDSSFGPPDFSGWNQCLAEWFPPILPEELNMDTQPISIDEFRAALQELGKLE
ncbi:GFA family protein [Porticoccus sp. GXU_MW_L64]